MNGRGRWVVIVLLVLLALWLRRGLRQPVEEKPNRIQAALDALIDLLKVQLADNFASERLAVMMFPFISTLFLYVLFCNWLGVFPYMMSPTQDINVTFGLALLVAVMTHVLAARINGVRKWLKGFIEPYPFMHEDRIYVVYSQFNDDDERRTAMATASNVRL